MGPKDGFPRSADHKAFTGASSMTAITRFAGLAMSWNLAHPPLSKYKFELRHSERATCQRQADAWCSLRGPPAGDIGRSLRPVCDHVCSVCVAALARRSGRRGAKVDAGTSDERRNDPGARQRATQRAGRLFARGFVAGLDRTTRYALRPASARDAKIAPAQMVRPGR